MPEKKRDAENSIHPSALSDMVNTMEKVKPEASPVMGKKPGFGEFHAFP